VSRIRNGDFCDHGISTRGRRLVLIGSVIPEFPGKTVVVGECFEHLVGEAGDTDDKKVDFAGVPPNLGEASLEGSRFPRLGRAFRRRGPLIG
jgi:hypothetical protein